MAIVEIQGVVKKVYQSSFTVAEKVQVPGYDFEKSYTVWSKTPPLQGATVTVRGKLTMKIKTYGDDHKSYIDVSINEPVVMILSEPVSTEVVVHDKL